MRRTGCVRHGLLLFPSFMCLMAVSSAHSQSDLFNGGLWWGQLAAMAVTVLGAVGFVIRDGTGWNWLFFACGVATGLLWLALTNRLTLIGFRRMAGSDLELQTARARFSAHNRRLYGPIAFSMGLAA